MPTNYPSNLDSWPTVGPLLSSTPHSDVHEDLQDAVEAIQTELGTDPAGSATTVRARITNAEDDIGTLDGQMAEMRTVAANRAAVLALSGVFAGRTVWETERKRLWTWTGSEWIITGGSMPRANQIRVTGFLTTGTSWQAVDISGFAGTDSDGFKSGTTFVVPTGMAGDYDVEATGCLISGYDSFEGEFGIGFRIYGNSGVNEVPRVEQWGTQPWGSASDEWGARAAAAKQVRLKEGALVQLTAFNNSGGALSWQSVSLSMAMISHVPSLT
jgi:hypothetical protein